MSEILQANSALNRGDPVEAEKILSQVIASGNFGPSAYLNRAAANSLLGKMDLMTNDIKEFCKLDPQWPKDNHDMTGFMKKYPDGPGLPKRRFFYLKGRFMIYYKQPLDEEPVGGACLQEFRIESKKSPMINNVVGALGVSGVVGVGGYQKFEIQLLKGTSEVRKYNLETETEQEKESWMAAFNKIKTLTNRDTRYVARSSARGQANAAKEGGWMYKRGQKGNTSWQRRWFVIIGTTLTYYQNNTDQKPKGSVELKDAVLKKIPDTEPGKFKFLLELKNKRKMYLYCETVEERNNWVVKLKIAIQGGPPKMEDSGGLAPDIPRGVSNLDRRAPTRPAISSPEIDIPERHLLPRRNRIGIVEHPVIDESNFLVETNLPMVNELISPIPVSAVLLEKELYPGGDEEEARNIDAIKYGGTLGNEEWDSASDDYIKSDDESCLIM